MDAPLGQPRQDCAELAVPHKRLAAHDRDVQGSVPVDERHEALDHLVTLVVGKAAEGDVAAQVFVAVGVAAGTAQRTFTRDFNGKVGSIA